MEVGNQLAERRRPLCIEAVLNRSVVDAVDQNPICRM